jgi:hypothetical protein
VGLTETVGVVDDGGLVTPWVSALALDVDAGLFASVRFVDGAVDLFEELVDEGQVLGRGVGLGEGLHALGARMGANPASELVVGRHADAPPSFPHETGR